MYGGPAVPFHWNSIFYFNFSLKFHFSLKVYFLWKWNLSTNDTPVAQLCQIHVISMGWTTCVKNLSTNDTHVAQLCQIHVISMGGPPVSKFFVKIVILTSDPKKSHFRSEIEKSVLQQIVFWAFLNNILKS